MPKEPPIFTSTALRLLIYRDSSRHLNLFDSDFERISTSILYLFHQCHFSFLPMSTTIQSEAPFAITTTFTAPTQCAESVGGLTMLKNDGFRIWLNHPLPVPGTTITSCYAPEFASSFLLERGGVSQAAMSPVVCPAGYTTQGPFTSNYIACCPRYRAFSYPVVICADHLQWLGWTRTSCQSAFRSTCIRWNLLQQHIRLDDPDHLI